ncbi:MAG: hypothetical protein ABSG43_09275 [Solirubrobacteraceae bacterium]|jgi:hypothetical protein
MSHLVFVHRSLRACLATAAVLTFTPAAASAAQPATPASCSTPTLTQPFESWGDAHYYTLAPGQQPDNFTASGWTLKGGATLTTSRLVDGATGQVLVLPAGASAISPDVCVNSTFPSARTMIRTAPASAGVSFKVSYPGTSGFQSTGELTGDGNGWTLSAPVSLQTAGLAGWQLAQYEFVAGAHSANVAVYNFYLDPYSSVVWRGFPLILI